MEGLSKTTQENTIEKTKIKEGVNLVFEQNPELSQIGTKEQYSEYLDTIFPESKIRDIVFHGTKFNFENFDKNELGKNTNHEHARRGFFFTNNVNNAYHYIGQIYTMFPVYKDVIRGFDIYNIKLEGAHEYVKRETNLFNKLKYTLNNFINRLFKTNIIFDFNDLKIAEEHLRKIEVEHNNYTDLINKFGEWINKYEELFGKYEGYLRVKENVLNLEKTSSPDIVLNINRMANEIYKRIPSDILGSEYRNKYYNSGNIKFILLDMKSPSTYTDNASKKDVDEFLKTYSIDDYTRKILVSKENGNDSVIFNDTRDPLISNIYVVFDSEQIHTLGGKGDVGNFKNFVENWHDSHA